MNSIISKALCINYMCGENAQPHSHTDRDLAPVYAKKSFRLFKVSKKNKIFKPVTNPPGSEPNFLDKPTAEQLGTNCRRIPSTVRPPASMTRGCTPSLSGTPIPCAAPNRNRSRNQIPHVGCSLPFPFPTRR